MKIKYIKDEALHIFRNNSETINKIIEKTQNKSWINSILGNNAFGITKIDVKDINFVIDKNIDPIETDYANAKAIFESLKSLNETQACDERLWIGLELNEGYDYMMYRYGIDNSTKFKYRWQFFAKGKRGLLYHGLARLWWYTKYTYDPSRTDPYELTLYGFKNQSIITKMFYRNYANNPNVVLSILEVLKRYDELGHTITLDIASKLYKEVGLIGSVSLIDAFTNEELTSLIDKKLSRIIAK